MSSYDASETPGGGVNHRREVEFGDTEAELGSHLLGESVRLVPAFSPDGTMTTSLAANSCNPSIRAVAGRAMFGLPAALMPARLSEVTTASTRFCASRSAPSRLHALAADVDTELR
jgi:hypothetical protein